MPRRRAKIGYVLRFDRYNLTDTAQDFFLSVLKATSNKREAKSYLQRFTPPRPSQAQYQPGALPRNLATKSAVLNTVLSGKEENFVNGTDPSVQEVGKFTVPGEELHVALVKIRDVGAIDDLTLQGVGRTLGQLKRLGLMTIVVVDEPQTEGWRKRAGELAERLVAAIENQRGKARRVDDAMCAKADGQLEVCTPDLLLAPLFRGMIPVVLPLAVSSTNHIIYADPYDTVLALTKSLASSATDDLSLERLIFIDPLGGIPAPDRPSGAHVFVNMQQEYSDIHSSLQHDPAFTPHLRALETLRECLAILPPTVSAIITTPTAASSARVPHRSKNPLIHNLLTDKPVFSSSLPTDYSPATQTTLLKHGTPLKLFPGGTKLTDPAIDLKKLVALIEDSFNKKLDVEHYLTRVNDCIAGVIIAGDYDGAAILTNETPTSNPSQKVCYLDKFAVAKRAQGVGGVADVVFKAMVASTSKGGFMEEAEGIVWRSRRNNPVNRWYFARARGTYKLKGGGDKWTMFWTTGEAATVRKRFSEYKQVCAGIEPSLRDKHGGGGE